MKYLLFILMLVLSVIILRLNLKLYSDDHTAAEQKEEVLLQLNFLEQELKHNQLGERMQEIFPEGIVFVNALYGLAWCELALADRQDMALQERAIKEALFAYENINSNAAASLFHSYLEPEYGIFYSGWKNYLLSKILTVSTSFQGHDAYLKEFRRQCDNIARALKASKSPFLESYNGQAWPADMSVAMASLSNHDKIFRPKYSADLKSWIRDVKTNLDPVTNLIPHKADPQTSQPVEGARGSSMGLILRMLAEIDPAFAGQQFERFDSLFVSKTFGLPSIREYPKGQTGLGDIDSGPVILGVGFAATIVQVGTLSMYGKKELANQQYKTIHAFGFDRKTDTEKYYLFGQLPMADVFIAWGRATDLHYETSAPEAGSSFWRIKFHAISLLILLIPWLIFFRKALLKHLTVSRKA